MILVVTYVLLSLFVAFALLGLVAHLTQEPKVSRLSFIASGVLLALSVMGLVAASV